ncbi:Uncharacterized protein Rs2_33612 [Raphanus sativus]|nr:Uncharacterized protein Rs2_33612 [Raphanus sativus]
MLKETTIKSQVKDRERQHLHRINTKCTKARRKRSKLDQIEQQARNSEKASMETNTHDHRKLHLHLTQEQKVEPENRGSKPPERETTKASSIIIENPILPPKKRRSRKAPPWLPSSGSGPPLKDRDEIGISPMIRRYLTDYAENKR